MIIFEIYSYKDPHKGYGYGSFKDYLITEDEELEKFKTTEPLEKPTASDVVEAAGYDTYGHGAKVCSVEELKKHLQEITEEAEKVLGAFHKLQEMNINL